MNDPMSVVKILGGVGMLINDFLAALSVLGSAILLFFAIFFPNASPRKLADFSYWSLAGLVLGGLLQVCMYINGNVPEKIGLFFRPSPLVVNLLFVLSFVLLLARLWVRRVRPPAPVRKGRRNNVHIHVGGNISASNLVVGDENEVSRTSIKRGK